MKLDQTDPEYMERLRHFAFVEVTSEEEQQLESEPRFLAILAALLGCQSTDLYRIMLPKALDSGLSPVAVKEMVYQSTDYLGMGRTWPFLSITNDILEERGISLPLPCQETTTLKNRLEKGAETQAAIFGEQMREAWKKSTVNRWLAANCFGDYYTRTGLQ